MTEDPQAVYNTDTGTQVEPEPIDAPTEPGWAGDKPAEPEPGTDASTAQPGASDTEPEPGAEPESSGEAEDRDVAQAAAPHDPLE